MFDDVSIHTYTRMDAYKSNVLTLCTIRHHNLCHTNSIAPKLIDPFSMKKIPPINLLHRWKNQISAARSIARNFFYVSTNIGNISLKEVDHLILLHNVQRTKLSVDQELGWLCQPYMKPIVQNLPSVASFEAYKSMIFNWPQDAFVDDLEISSQDLSMLCLKRYLGGDHMRWVSRQLNKQCQSVLVIYVNSVRDLKNHVRIMARKGKKMEEVEKICIIVNIGQKGTETFLGSDGKNGNHYSVFFVEKEKDILYGDTLGWKYPNEMLPKLKELMFLVWGIRTEPNIIHMHDHEQHRLHRKCSNKCLPYPLQTCGTICGVISCMMAAIFSLNESMFLKVSTPLDENDGLFIRNPTRYSKYLRRVLMCWMSSANIDISNVTPIENGNENDSGDEEVLTVAGMESDDDGEEVSVSPSQPIIKQEKGTNQNHTNQDKTTIEQKECKSQKEKGNEKADKDVVERFQCPECSSAYTRKRDLRRHVAKKHKETSTAIYESGNALCLNCGRRFYRATELKVHLHTEHGMTFNEMCEIRIQGTWLD